MDITIFLIAMALGSALTNIRYYFIIKKNTRNMMEKPRQYKATHSRGETTDGDVYVYCPIGNIFSWSHGDYNHKWCHYCQIFFSDKVNKLLDENEQEMKAI